MKAAIAALLYLAILVTAGSVIGSLAACTHTDPCPFDQFLIDPACH
jgi:hypothetical protein